jgi:hypothetical protein
MYENVSKYQVHAHWFTCACSYHYTTTQVFVSGMRMVHESSWINAASLTVKRVTSGQCTVFSGGISVPSTKPCMTITLVGTNRSSLFSSSSSSSSSSPHSPPSHSPPSHSLPPHSPPRLVVHSIHRSILTLLLYGWCFSSPTHSHTLSLFSSLLFSSLLCL